MKVLKFLAMPFLLAWVVCLVIFWTLWELTDDGIKWVSTRGHLKYK